MMKEAFSELILGAGCFWCVEAAFQRVKGVQTVTSGYTGGHVPNPTYQQVCTKTTGHIEVIRLRYSPVEISLQNLIRIFLYAHDPTQADGQGYDIGPQYISALFYSNLEQKTIMEQTIIQEQPHFQKPIVTKLLPKAEFYPAEDYHQNYFNENGSTNPYCQIIPPKLEKLKKLFAQYTKP